MVKTEIGIRTAASYFPRYRLTGAEIARSHNREGGRGQRSLAGPDEDSLTLAIEAARRLPTEALRQTKALVFCSTTAPYLVKNNASAAHAALGLDPNVPAYDAGGSLRSVLGVLLSAEPGTLILAGDINTSRPGSPIELLHGDAGAALLIGDADSAAAVITGSVSMTEEIQDHWRDPKKPWISQSEDRFPVSRYLSLLSDALKDSQVDTCDQVVVSTPSARLTKAAGKELAALGTVHTLDGVGYAGTADLLVKLSDALAAASSGHTLTAVSLADGCDVLTVRVTDNVHGAFHPGPIGSGVVPSYLDALTWRGILDREPPRRPEPRTVSAPAAMRGVKWKYALQGSTCLACGNVSTPPQQVCVRCGSTEHGDPVVMTDKNATIRTFSVDRLAYTLNPPMVAAVVGFDGGGRLEVEITDTDPDSLFVGAPARMTFRRRHSSGGVHNYVWKATAEGGAQ
ncbi:MULTISPECIES: OB-fold domain-containing protein [Rhodococcus]|nr:MULTISPECIES: OB-fold domain-containing protein [Rhodococcus]QQZ14638.1 OB-fold domain-containing protein [Rhodococcus sp. 21391]